MESGCMSHVCRPRGSYTVTVMCLNKFKIIRAVVINLFESLPPQENVGLFKNVLFSKLCVHKQCSQCSGSRVEMCRAFDVF